MKKVELSKTGTLVSEVSWGCMLMGSAIDRATSFAMLDIHLTDEQLATLNNASA